MSSYLAATPTSTSREIELARERGAFRATTAVLGGYAGMIFITTRARDTECPICCFAAAMGVRLGR